MARSPGRGARAARKTIAAIVALAALLGGSPGASAQQAPPGEIAGTVVEAETGRPVAAAAVVLEPGEGAVPDGPADEARSRQTATDAEGRYRFTDVPAGWYRLSVTALGYLDADLWIELPESWSVRRSLGLEIRPVELRPVHVTVGGPLAGGWSRGEAPPGRTSPGASAWGSERARPTLDARALTPGSVRELATFGEPDVLRALQHLPGASSQGDYSAGLWTRGAPWGLTQVMLDGLPLYHPLHLGGTASGLTAESLEAVQFLPGARPAAFSDGAAGVVNLVTRRAGGEPSATVGLSPFALRSHVEGRWLDDRVGLSVAGRRSWWDKVGAPSLFTGDAGSVDYWFADVVGRLDVRVADWGTIEAAGLWEEDRVHGDIEGLKVAASSGSWGNDLGWLSFAAAGAGVRGRLTVGRTVHTTGTRPQPWASFYTPRGYTLDPVDVDLARSMARLEMAGGGPGPVEWEAGVDRARETLTQFSADAVDRSAPGVDAPAEVGWVRAWGQGTARVGPALLSAGLAWDAPLEGDPPGLGFLPNGSVRVDVTDRLTVEAAHGSGRQFTYPFARAGRSFGPALGIDHVWMMAGDGRSPITSDVGTLGLELRLDGGFGGGMTGWRRAMEGLALDRVAVIDGGSLVPSPSFEGEEGRERSHGVEATVWRREGRVRGEVGYSWGVHRVEAPGGSTWEPPSDRRHSLDVVLSAWARPTLRLGATFRAESGWPYAVGPWTCPEGGEEPCIEIGDPRRPAEHSVRRAPAYRSLDLMVDWTRPGETVSWAVSVALRNALGTDNKAAFRPAGCRGAEMISVVCEGAVGVGEFGNGLTSPTPAVAVRVHF